jgi:trigger factor
VKSVVETVSATRVKVVTEVPFEELSESIDKAYQSIASQVTIPGFRKGKVPPRIIDQRFGRGAVLEEAINDALPQLYAQVVEEHDLHPLGSPEVEVTDLQDGTSLSFTAEVDVRPTIELPAWEGLAVTVEDVEISDEQVDEQVEQLRARFGSLKPVERAAAEGDHVVLDLAATDDEGAAIEDAQASGLSYQVGSGTMIEGLDDAVRGLSAGESATFSTMLLGTKEGTEASVSVTVTAVKEQELPDLDDEFAQLASEFDTVDELRADVREQLVRFGRLQQALQARDHVLAALLESVDFEVPERIVEAQVEQHFADGHGDDEHRADYAQDVVKTLRTQLLLDEIVKTAEVGVSQEEVTDYLVQRARQARMDLNEYAQQLVSSGGAQAVVADVARGKALALAVERATVTTTSGEVLDLMRLQEDGTYADEADDAELETEGDDTAALGAAAVPDDVTLIGFDDAPAAAPAEAPAADETSDAPASAEPETGSDAAQQA